MEAGGSCALTLNSPRALLLFPPQHLCWTPAWKPDPLTLFFVLMEGPSFMGKTMPQRLEDPAAQECRLVMRYITGRITLGQAEAELGTLGYDKVSKGQ